MNKKILIVDDEEMLCDMLKEMLSREEEKYDVTVAKDGFDALQKIKEEMPDIILLDVIMPRFDGHSLLMCIKQDESMKHIPVIMLTANSHLEDLCGIEGADGYIVKPFVYADLKKKIEQILEV